MWLNEQSRWAAKHCNDSCRSSIVGCGNSHDRNTSGIRVLLAQRSLCGGEQTVGQLALLWESEYVTARLADLTVGVNIMGHRLMLNIDKNFSRLVLYRLKHWVRPRHRYISSIYLYRIILPDHDAYGCTDGAVNIRSNTPTWADSLISIKTSEFFSINLHIDVSELLL